MHVCGNVAHHISPIDKKYELFVGQRLERLHKQLELALPALKGAAVRAKNAAAQKARSEALLLSCCAPALACS